MDSTMINRGVRELPVSSSVANAMDQPDAGND